MASSAFKSSSKRGAYPSPSTASSSSSKDRPLGDSGKKIPLRRSRSVASLPRSRGNTALRSSDVTEYSNTRDNPLFGCSSSSPSPESELAGGTVRGDAFDCRRGRSMSRNFSFRNESSCGRSESGRRLSRDVIGRRRLRSLSSSHYGISEVQRWKDRVSTGSLSEAEESSTRAYFQSDHIYGSLGSGGIYETVGSEVRHAFSEIRPDPENVIMRKKPAIITMDNIANIPTELVNPDAIELVSDIRMEYAIKLEQSQERTRKLRADLAVEEQRGQELSRILKEMLTDSKSSETQKSQTKRKASIERIKMSRRLAEEAMNYFDECVSLSTFDGSDFSSPEDQQTSSILGVIPTRSRRFFSNGCSTFSASNYPNSQFEHHEGVDNNTTCSQNIAGSDFEISSNCSGKATYLMHQNGHDDLPESDTSRSGKSHFSFAHQAHQRTGLHEIRSYIKKFEKDISKGEEEVKIRSSHNAEDYVLNSLGENFLLEKVIHKNRIESGGLLVCNIRIF